VSEARGIGYRVLVVDRDERCLARSLTDSATEIPSDILRAGKEDALFLPGDGVRTLADILGEWVPDLVVPAAGGHLAALLAVEHCRRQSRALVPAPDLLSSVRDRLPSRWVCLADEPSAVLVTSYMDGGSCMEDCSQPVTCPVTGSTNTVPMHELIDAALRSAVDHRIVLVTSDLGAVGGVRGGDLIAMLSMLDEAGPGNTIGIATSCRCHGVLNLMRISGHQQGQRKGDNTLGRPSSK
jgi:hypothetical protein